MGCAPQIICLRVQPAGSGCLRKQPIFVRVRLEDRMHYIVLSSQVHSEEKLCLAVPASGSILGGSDSRPVVKV